jgi:hypothetical protein
VSSLNLLMNQMILRYLQLSLSVWFAIAELGCSQVQQAQTKAQRVPLEKHQREYRAPINYAPREIGYDRKTGKPISYDHKPHTEVLDQKTGRYLLKWIGYDGKEKTVVFQRGDAVDVIVNASASKTSQGYLYSYQAASLPSSGTYLSGFILQNYAQDARPYEVNGARTTLADLRLLDSFRNVPRDGSSPQVGGILIGQMSNMIAQFSKGGWINFAPLSRDNPLITPGKVLEVRLTSEAPPGLVECRVTGGQLTLQGADEDMPAVLEDMLPGYEEFPHGYSVGPVEYLKTLSPSEKSKYVLERLPTFKKAGWITDDALRRYEAELKNGSMERIFARAEADLKTEQITTEVFAIIQGMK